MKLEKPYCVWDAVNNDFLENFETLKKAKEYCEQQRKNGVFGIYKIGKWISNDSESTEYKEICRIY